MLTRANVEGARFVGCELGGADLPDGLRRTRMTVRKNLRLVVGEIREGARAPLARRADRDPHLRVQGVRGRGRLAARGRRGRAARCAHRACGDGLRRARDLASASPRSAGARAVRGRGRAGQRARRWTRGCRSSRRAPSRRRAPQRRAPHRALRRRAPPPPSGAPAPMPITPTPQLATAPRPAAAPIPAANAPTPAAATPNAAPASPGSANKTDEPTESDSRFSRLEVD